jgi:hypothetical protein
VFGSLDYIYLPTADVDGEVLRYVKTMGAELAWKVRARGTTVAAVPGRGLARHRGGREPALGDVAEHGGQRPVNGWSSIGP